MTETKDKKPFAFRVRLPQKLRIRSKKTAAAVSSVFLVTATMGILVIKQNDNSQKTVNLAPVNECLDQSKAASVAYDKQDFKTAYESLAQKKDGCDQLGNAADATRQAQVLIYNAELAKAAYRSGNKEAAKEAADKVLEAQKQSGSRTEALSYDERTALMEAQEIKQGKYEEQ